MADDDGQEFVDELEQFLRDFEAQHGPIIMEDRFVFPMTVNRIVHRGRLPSLYAERVGGSVRIRPVGEEHGGRTYLGLYLGDLSTGPSMYITQKSRELSVVNETNPAIWVPELNRVVWGYESWWAPINTLEDFDREITDDDIQNIWYVKLLRAGLEKRREEQA